MVLRFHRLLVGLIGLIVVFSLTIVDTYAFPNANSNVAISKQFYRALNLNGPATTIDGRTWEGKTAPNYSFTGTSFENQGVALTPATDAVRAKMLRSSIYNNAGSNVALHNVPAGSYDVYLYVWEDTWPETYSISVEGGRVLSNYTSGSAGQWAKLGPWSTTVSDGTLNVVASAGAANFSGIEVWRSTSTSPPATPTATMPVAMTPVPTNTSAPTVVASTGSTFYVSPSGNDSNPGMLGQPWRTAAKAAAMLRAGDTAIFEDGTYYETAITQFANDGTAAAPITIKARNKHNAVLFYRGITVQKILITKRYITVQDFEITQDVRGSGVADQTVRCQNTSNCTVRGNKIHNSTYCVRANQATNPLFEGNTCYNTGSIAAFNSLAPIIRNNTIDSINDSGIYVKGGTRSAQIYNNLIRSNVAWTIGINLGGYSCVQDCGIYDPSGYEAYNSVAYNNVIISTTPGKIDIGLLIRACNSCAFYNNVVVGARWGMMTMKSPGMNVGWTWNPMPRNPVFVNNIVQDCTVGSAYFGDYLGVLSVDYNIFSSCATPPPQVHGINADPMLVDKYSDWRLRPGSPAIDSGQTGSTFLGFQTEPINISLDRNGVIRQTPTDRGVYEQ